MKEVGEAKPDRRIEAVLLGAGENVRENINMQLNFFYGNPDIHRKTHVCGLQLLSKCY